MKAVVFLLGLVLTGVHVTVQPTAVEAQTYTPHPGIQIFGNEGFVPGNGVVAGIGTPSDPFVIGGWEITNGIDTGFVSIHDTNASFVLRNLYLHSVYRESSGIWLNNVTNGVIEDIRTSGMLDGVHIRYSSNITLSRNTFEFDGVWIQQDTAEQWRSIRISEDNTVNGLPLRFYHDCQGLKLNGISAGQIIVANCVDVRIANVRVGEAIGAVLLAFVEGATVSGAILSHQHWGGIFAVNSSGLAFIANRIAGVRQGVLGSGVAAVGSANVTIASNVLSSNMDGIVLVDSKHVTVIGNSIASNVDLALYLSRTTDLRVYGNDFIANGGDALDVEGSESTWDAGYPVGGNYWSSGPVEDRCNGPHQDSCNGGDGIGDKEHNVGRAGQSIGVDHYPLAQPILAADLPPTVPANLFLLAEGSAVGLAIALAAVALVLLWRRGSRHRRRAPKSPSAEEKAEKEREPQRPDE